jgi:hypothetical protein
MMVLTHPAWMIEIDSKRPLLLDKKTAGLSLISHCLIVCLLVSNIRLRTRITQYWGRKK